MATRRLKAATLDRDSVINAAIAGVSVRQMADTAVRKTLCRPRSTSLPWKCRSPPIARRLWRLRLQGWKCSKRISPGSRLRTRMPRRGRWFRS
jgi:hypothetical protein